jgi:2-polyprenyl-6-methoxyphenol hydroxylase-like FAD-dependent oxidoreductase
VLIISYFKGDGFTIGPTAIKAVQQWPDMVDENEAIASSPWISWHNLSGERLSGAEPLSFKDSKDGKIDTPQRIYRHSRPKFHKMLSDQAERIGIFVEYGMKVVEYVECDGRAGVVTESGERIEADVVISADGIGSKSSAVTMGRDVKARSSGRAMYRAAYDVEIALADPVVRERFPLMEDGTPVVELWMGYGLFLSLRCRMALIICRQGQHVIFARDEDTMTWAVTYPVCGSIYWELHALY